MNIIQMMKNLIDLKEISLNQIKFIQIIIKVIIIKHLNLMIQNK